MKSTLVIEGNTTTVDLITFLLPVSGYIIKEAGCGLKTLKIAGKTRFDIIFLDLQLPGFRGLKIFEKLKCSLKQTGRCNSSFYRLCMLIWTNFFKQYSVGTSQSL